MNDLVPLSEIMRATGLTADQLRMWDRRYGWPKAVGRGERGERLYTIEQLYKIRHVARMIKLGGRISELVPAAKPQR
jgi:DNA-binding transcriptional MerR regulator